MAANETKWTPGPWKVVKDRDAFDPWSIRMGTALKRSDGYQSIHRIDIDWGIERGTPDYAEGRANLRLIAAAPSLYDALAAVLELPSMLVERGFLSHGIGTNTPDGRVVLSALAALALARGETKEG